MDYVSLALCVCVFCCARWQRQRQRPPNFYSDFHVLCSSFNAPSAYMGWTHNTQSVYVDSSMHLMRMREVCVCVYTCIKCNKTAMQGNRGGEHQHTQHIYRNSLLNIMINKLSVLLVGLANYKTHAHRLFSCIMLFHCYSFLFK